MREYDLLVFFAFSERRKTYLLNVDALSTPTAPAYISGYL